MVKVIIKLKNGLSLELDSSLTKEEAEKECKEVLKLLKNVIDCKVVN